MADITVRKGQGISQAIASKLGLNKEQLKGIKLETWQSVMTEISNIQEKRNKTPEDDNIFTGGNDVSTINKRENWKSNFIVQEGTFSIDDESWKKIEKMLTGKTPEPKTEPPADEKPPVEEPPVEEPPQETPEPKTEPKLQDIPDGAKIKRRDIANVGEEGSKETVAKVKENGVKKYYQVETDPETHEEKLGQRLVADKRGIFRKNQYYSVDASIPDGARADLKTVDGQKESVTVSFKGDDNKTHIYATKLSDDGTLTLGDELVKIAGSKKYYTQSKVNAHLQEAFGTSTLPENVTVQLIESKGDVEYIYKKDGKRVDENDVKAMLNPQTKPEGSATPTDPKTEPKPTEPEGSSVPTSPTKPNDSTTPTVSPANPKQTKMTPQEVEGFVNADSRVTAVISQLPTLKQNAESLQQQHDAAWKAKDIEKLNQYSLVDVQQAKSKFEYAQRAVQQYKEAIANWQDGTKIHLYTGSLAGDFEMVTLDNGAKGYKGERYENGKKVIYYMNVDFNTKFGMAGSIGSLYKKITE